MVMPRRRVLFMQRVYVACVCLTGLACFTLSYWFQGHLVTAPPVGHQTRLITINRRGRTGNLMFLVATLLGLAHRHALTPVLPQNYPLRSLFQLSIAPGDATNMTRPAHYQEFGQRASAYDVSTQHLVYPREYILHGFFQSWMYFDKVHAEIRRQFIFLPQHREAADTFYENNRHRLKDKLKIGIHVRRGDTLHANSIKFGYTTAPKDYFDRARTYLTARYQDIVFIVCSDDIDWCHDNITGENIIYSSSASDAEDMAILSRCDHTIISTGSFGWWSAWLANGTTVYYDNWPRPFSTLEYMVDKKQYFPPHWVALK